MSKVVVGIDVGGTNIKLGIVQPSGQITATTNLLTKNFIREKDLLINGLVEAVCSLLESNALHKNDIRGIGIGLPGLIDYKKGFVHFLPNIPSWKNVPLKKIMEERLRIPAFIDNDVNLITLGEWHYGAGRGIRNMVCITLGTGVGGGLILDNALYRGEGFTAGEIGHVPLNERDRKSVV